MMAAVMLSCAHCGRMFDRHNVKQKMCSIECRFWSKVDKDGPLHPTRGTPCWVWTGHVQTKGYGVFREDKLVKAHRWAYESANGLAPGDMQIDHTCLNRRCVNPDHLRLASNKQQAENRGGARRGSKSGVRGVTWKAMLGKWQANVGHNGKKIYIGVFSDLADAERAVIKKRLELFTHNEVDRAGAEGVGYEHI